MLTFVFIYVNSGLVFETLGPIKTEDLTFLSDLGQKLGTCRKLIRLYSNVYP